MRVPNDIQSVFRLAEDAARSEAEDFFARQSRQRQVELAVLGPWENAELSTPENRRLVMLGARAGLAQFLFERSLFEMIGDDWKGITP
jgi:hypothetical protein